MNEIRIRVTDNGYILEHWEKNEEGFWEVVATHVFENGDTESDDLQAFIRLVYALSDSIAPTTGRYSPERLVVKTEPGDKYEDTHEEEKTIA